MIRRLLRRLALRAEAKTSAWVVPFNKINSMPPEEVVALIEKATKNFPGDPAIHACQVHMQMRSMAEAMQQQEAEAQARDDKKANKNAAKAARKNGEVLPFPSKN